MDAEAMQAIYAPYVERTAITFEVEAPSVEEFGRRIRHTQEKYPWLVAERNGEVLGYAYLGEFKSRAAYAHSAETSIYVRMDTPQRNSLPNTMRNLWKTMARDAAISSVTIRS